MVWCKRCGIVRSEGTYCRHGDPATVAKKMEPLPEYHPLHPKSMLHSKATGS